MTKYQDELFLFQGIPSPIKILTVVSTLCWKNQFLGNATGIALSSNFFFQPWCKRAHFYTSGKPGDTFLINQWRARELLQSKSTMAASTNFCVENEKFSLNILPVVYQCASCLSYEIGTRLILSFFASDVSSHNWHTFWSSSDMSNLWILEGGLASLVDHEIVTSLSWCRKMDM